MNLSQWEEKYKPIKNAINTNSSWDGTMFETFGDEVNAVIAEDPAKVWTLIEADDEEMIISNGFHRVNRMGYFITEVAHTGPDITIMADSPTDDITIEEAYEAFKTLGVSLDEIDEVDEDIIEALENDFNHSGYRLIAAINLYKKGIEAMIENDAVLAGVAALKP